MKKQSIAVVDSGVGGISVLNELVKNFPNEHFIYFGDNKNAPYGNLSYQNLLSITLRNIDFVKGRGIKGIVLACNTLSVSLLREIKEYSGLPIFCVFPPVEECQIKKEKTLLLATERTAKKYSSFNNIDVVGLKDLAFIIEQNIFNLSRFDFNGYFNKAVKPNIKKGYYKNVILGCTHYNFVKNQIFVHFRPQNLYDGTENLLKEMRKCYQTKKTLVKYKGFNPLFVGQYASSNEHIYNLSGQKAYF